MVLIIRNVPITAMKEHCRGTATFHSQCDKHLGDLDNQTLIQTAQPTHKT